MWSRASQCSDGILSTRFRFQSHLKPKLTEDELGKGNPTWDGGADHEPLRRLGKLHPVQVVQLVVQALQDDPSPAGLAVVQVHVDLVVCQVLPHHLNATKLFLANKERNSNFATLADAVLGSN